MSRGDVTGRYRVMVMLPDVPVGGLTALPAVDGVMMSAVGAAEAPAPTLEPTALPLAAGLPPGLPGRVSRPPKPGTGESGMGDDWAQTGMGAPSRAPIRMQT